MKTPDFIIVADDDGTPKSMVDVDRLQTDATRLMYQLAVSAGDDDATDKVSERWVAAHDPDYFGYLAAATLSLLVRNVLAPTLDAAEAVGLHLRDGLRAAASQAESELS